MKLESSTRTINWVSWTMHIMKDAIPDNQFEFSPDSDTELSNSENESE